MAITAYGPPFYSTDPSFKQKDWAAVPGAYDSNAFGQAGRFEKPVVHKPYIPEVEGRKAERERKTLRELVAELEAEDRRTEQVGGTHYAEMTVQPWDAMRAWFTPAEYASYHIGTVIGYLSRHRRKGGLNDIKKAHHHLSELIRYFEEEEEYE